MRSATQPPRSHVSYQSALDDWLKQFLTSRRWQRFHEVLDLRTRWIHVVVCDLFQQHNASAILRTCDALGIQNVTIVEDAYEAQVNSEISLGAEQWLSVQRCGGPDAIDQEIDNLRAAGFKIVATTPGEQTSTPESLSMDQPVAVLFGTEKTGLPETAVAQADELLTVPMYGFTESLNVSVAAAVCLRALVLRLQDSSFDWQLTEQQRSALLSDWIRQSIPRVESLEQRFQQEWTRKRSR